MPNKQELLQLVEELRGCDHAFLSDEVVQHYTKPFGFEGQSYQHYANPNHPKGLTLNNGQESALGLGAHELAEQICRHLGVKYPEMFGRGSQLRVCCDAIEEYINKTHGE